MKAWIRMPLELLQRQGMKKSAAIILGVIIDRCTDNADGCATVSRSDIVHASGYSLSAVKRALQELQALELISAHRTGRASVYTLTGAVEILPPKVRGSRAAQRRAAHELDRIRAEQEEREYMSLSNRFKEDEEA